MTAFGLGWVQTLGLTELLIILLALVVLFGASKIPRLARSIREGRKEFRKAARGSEKSPGTRE